MPHEILERRNSGTGEAGGAIKPETTLSGAAALSTNSTGFVNVTPGSREGAWLGECSR
jgi:hypothetical protein